MVVLIIIYNVIGVLLVGSLGVALFNWVYEKTETVVIDNKNTRRKIALEMIEEVVVYTQDNFKGGTIQRENAIKIIDKRIEENGWSKYFTTTQLEQMTEAVYKSLKLKGVLK